MAALASFVSNAVEKLLFRPVTVVNSELLEGGTRGGPFRLVRMQGQGFEGVRWTPGQVSQFYLGSLTKRAYTPMDVDAQAGSASFLFYLHGEGPGSRWAAALEAGHVCQVMRPRDSLDFTSLQGDAIFFGDETSLAAAQALQSCSESTVGRRYVLEARAVGAAEVVASKLGLDRLTLIQKKEDGSHLAAVVAKLAEQAAEMQSPQWVFTGQALSIQGVRKQLKAKGIELKRSKVRAYWSPGKTGMD